MGSTSSRSGAISSTVLPSSSARPTCTGQDECHGFGIVPTALGKLMRDELLRVWGDGTAERDLLCIEDFQAPSALCSTNQRK